MIMSVRDFERMGSDVRNIIKDWSVSGIISTPLPQEEQPNWDPIMREVVGDMEYDVQHDVPIEIRAKSGDHQIDVTMSGDKRVDEMSLQISSEYTITDESIVQLSTYPNVDWRIIGIRRSVGEYIVQVVRLDGDK